MTKPALIPQPLRTLMVTEIRRAKSAARVAPAVLVQMNLRSRGDRRP